MTVDEAILAQLTNVAEGLGSVRSELEENKERWTECRDAIRSLPCRDQSGIVPAACVLGDRQATPADRAAGRSPSNLYKAVEAQVDKHVEDVEDSLTDRINLAALQAVKQAAKDEARDRAEEVKCASEEEARKVKLAADNEISRLNVDLQKTQAKAAKFKIWGGTVAALLVTIGGAVGWKSCEVLGTVQARTEATLKKIEVKQAVRPVKPDAAVGPLAP